MSFSSALAQNKRKISLAISPCPNDTFAFYHLLHHQEIRKNINVKFLDISELNQGCINNTFDISKVSFACYLQKQKDYQLLETGAAIAHHCGPLLISQSKEHAFNNSSKILIPGKLTTANLLLQFYLKDKGFSNDLEETIFSKIIPRIQKEKNYFGVIIHEGRFILEQEKIHLIQDLGQWWKNKTKQMIPLGAVIAKKTIPTEIKQKFITALHKSIQWAWDNSNNKELEDFILQHSQLSKKICLQHIKTYVTQDTKQLSTKAKQAISFLKNKTK